MKIRCFLYSLVVLTGLLTRAVTAAPDIATWTTTNGAQVLFTAAPELPIVDIKIVFDAGSARDGNKSGLAVLTNGLLAEGAGGLSAEVISERFEEVGARFSNSAERDTASVGLRSLTEPGNLEPAMTLLATVLSRPEFPVKVLERERARLLVSIKQRQQDPSDIAEDAFFANVYRGHPYAAPTSGTENTVKTITRADLETFYKTYYNATNAVVAIVGAVTPEQARQLAEQAVGKLPAGKPAPALPEVPVLTKPVELKISYPSSQTHILIGQPGMSRLDPNFYVLYVGNHALGGSGLVSRLAEEVREKRGLSYSVYSYFMPMRMAGPFQAGVQTRNAQAQKSLAVLLETLRGYVDNGPTAEELKASLLNITGGFPLRIDSNSDKVEYLAMIGFYHLPLDYLDKFVERVQAVGLDQIKDAFKRRINPANLVTVMVGGEPKPGEESDAPLPKVEAGHHH